MLKSAAWVGMCLALSTWFLHPSALAEEIPTADSILKIYTANRQKLNKLHVRLIHTEETTKAFGRWAKHEADIREKAIESLIHAKPEDLKIKVDGKPLSEEEAREHVAQLTGPEARQQIEFLRSSVKPFCLIEPIEIFSHGDDYQFRSPAQSPAVDESLLSFAFPEVPVTADALVKTYGKMSIYSRCAGLSPAARWWHFSIDGPAYVTNKQLGALKSTNPPPFTDVMQPRWDCRHPYDAFFSAPVDAYRVVRQETIDGRRLTVVDVEVPLMPNSPTRFYYRAWLDLDRGALPIRLYEQKGNAEMPADYFDRQSPHEITTTREIRELPNGAFYPTNVMMERMGPVPEQPERVAHRRHVWKCSLVEIKADFDDNFFLIPFPDGQKIYDHDAGKILGALVAKPLVRVGQKAPALTVARWIDGKERTLADLKGQVIVLDFWGLWCGPCRRSVPHLKALQDRFEGKPVTFISIHTADRDVADLAKRIEEFQKNNDWHYIAAIDAGRMVEDSITTHAYGIAGFPTKLVIDREGKVAYVDNEVVGPSPSEQDPAAVADFEKRVFAVVKRRFESVGQEWPLAEGLSEEQQAAIYARVDLLYTCQQIEAVLETSPGTD